MSDPAAQIARTVIDQFWLAQVKRIAEVTLQRPDEGRAPFQMYPPREADYARAAEALRILTRPAETAVALAVPTTRKKQR
jgi:hypothetical protein